MAPTPGTRQAASLRAVTRKDAVDSRAKASPWSHLYAREPFPFADIDAAGLADGIAHTLGAGNALTLSLTADGGAVKVTLWVDGTKHIAYAGTAQLFDELMEALGPPLQPDEITKSQ